jgi:hypothetical protein
MPSNAGRRAGYISSVDELCCRAPLVAPPPPSLASSCGMEVMTPLASAIAWSASKLYCCCVRRDAGGLRHRH